VVAVALLTSLARPTSWTGGATGYRRRLLRITLRRLLGAGRARG